MSSLAGDSEDIRVGDAAGPHIAPFPLNSPAESTLLWEGGCKHSVRSFFILLMDLGRQLYNDIKNNKMYQLRNMG